MVQELERWRAENDKHKESLRREERYGHLLALMATPALINAVRHL